MEAQAVTAVIMDEKATIQVTAPSNLEAGYRFQVQDANRSLCVQVVRDSHTSISDISHKLTLRLHYSPPEESDKAKHSRHSSLARLQYAHIIFLRVNGVIPSAIAFTMDSVILV